MNCVFSSGKHGIEGTKIGIESQGDTSGRLKKSLPLFADVGCVVIICATRTYGQTVDAVNELQPVYEVLWLKQTEKSSVSEQQANNNAMAQKIVGEAEKVIGV
ncbi:MAG: hypothetical protein Q8M92_08575 [Candidatus Subteraquimicrobiales bacterium]|nr:hypothetical protein [Candidatus Subteraquimicrobiales bacterium]